MAAVPFGTGGALFFGGLDASGSPIDTVQNFQAATATNAGTLPAPDASAVAAALGPNIYLFGGASSTIYQLTGTSFSVAGSLPAATADAAVATVAGTAYVIGGYTGSAELDTIVAYTPNAPGNVTGEHGVHGGYPDGRRDDADRRDAPGRAPPPGSGGDRRPGLHRRRLDRRDPPRDGVPLRSDHRRRDHRRDAPPRA